MNRERAKELLRDAKKALHIATALRLLIDDFPSWDKLGNHFNFVDGIDEIRAKVEVLKLLADESTRVNEEDLYEVLGWLTEEE